MKHGLGSPGYIARMAARHYVALRAAKPFLDEAEVLRQILVNRIAAQSTLGGPEEYKTARSNPELIDAIIRINPDLFALIRCMVFIEHPEFNKRGALANRFEVLDEVLNEVMGQEVAEWEKPTLKEPTIVDGSQFEDTSVLPMYWTAWHNGSHHNLFTGFGFKISQVDRDLYFDRTWKKITIALPLDAGFALTEANIDKSSFWESDCRELIAKDIGLWLMGKKYAPWPKGQPPRFLAWPIGDASFRVELYEGQRSI
jgi:hypothetical protein